MKQIKRILSLFMALLFMLAMLPAPAPSADATPALALEEKQVLAQIAQLERKRKELDAAIVALRETHTGMVGDSAKAVSAA